MFAFFCFSPINLLLLQPQKSILEFHKTVITKPSLIDRFSVILYYFSNNNNLKEDLK